MKIVFYISLLLLFTFGCEKQPPVSEKKVTAWDLKWDDYKDDLVLELPSMTPYDRSKELKREFLKGFKNGFDACYERKGKPLIYDFFPSTDEQHAWTD